MQVRETPPFAPVLMESTRAIGYSLEAAIADIIDNSIAAKAGKVQLSFFPVGDAYVSILDNGTGMDDAQMNIAMQYGSKSPTETRDSSDLGRYGLGLKTASLSQCRVLTVISKQGDQVIGRRWDLDYVIKTGAWSLLILDKEDFASVPHISDLYEQESGTLVVWQNLDRLLMGEVDYEKSLGRKMDEVRQHLELVFHRYLSGESGIKKLEILFNGVKLKAADPFLIKKSTQAMDTETLVIRGKRILVTPYILPHISKMTEEEKNQLGGKDGIRKRQGFYVYRNKRLLIWGTWFRMMRQGDLSKLARVMVDIPNDLDDLWTLDIKKSHAIPPAEVRNSLQTVIDRIADKSKRTWTFRGKKETSDSVEHKSWLPSRRADLDFFFWNRYKKYLEEIKHWNPRVTATLDKVSDEIVDLLGDPQSKEPFQRRGLVLGDVQSGKTANYTAISNKAADTGYRIIIVLAGMMENLRQQTQSRLDAEFSGRKSEYYLDPKAEQGIKNQPVGVGRYGVQKRIAAFTSVTKDFDINVLKSNDLNLQSVSDPIVLVVKKNKRILNNLIKWLSNSRDNTTGKIMLPMLLIDDEADNASVNTKSEDDSPAAINACIRQLLHEFNQASYLGITATPFANIFINPETEDEMIGDDLFPRDFIYSLAPPTNYIGADKIFGDATEKFSDVLIPLRREEMDLFFPFTHKKTLEVDALPPSMYEAIASCSTLMS